MAQGRSTQIISTIKWIWTSTLSIKNDLSLETHRVHARAAPPEGEGRALDGEVDSQVGGNPDISPLSL